MVRRRLPSRCPSAHRLGQLGRVLINLLLHQESFRSLLFDFLPHLVDVAHGLIVLFVVIVPLNLHLSEIP